VVVRNHEAGECATSSVAHVDVLPGRHES